MFQSILKKKSASPQNELFIRIFYPNFCVIFQIILSMSFGTSTKVGDRFTNENSNTQELIMLCLVHNIIAGLFSTHSNIFGSYRNNFQTNWIFPRVRETSGSYFCELSTHIIVLSIKQIGFFTCISKVSVTLNSSTLCYFGHNRSSRYPVMPVCYKVSGSL